MLSPAPPLTFRKRRNRKAHIPSKPAIGPLMLIAATYIEATSVTLTFSRAVSIADVDPAAITVDDGTVGFRYGGIETHQPTTSSVEIILSGLEELPFVGVHLTATSGNGIVAVGDGAAWSGAADVELPFP